jgi:2,4-diaminopentanoate dehydrogenase
MSERPYRVVQWATGNIGMASLRAVIEHPNMQLVGLYVYSDAKKGRDAGELCGLPPTGVMATGDIEDVLALKPDCVLYMPDRAEIGVLCRLLESGANVVATRSEFHGPGGLQPEDRELIEAACQRGGTSIHSTGSSPGFSSEALPFLLLSTTRRLECYTTEEFADMSSRNSPEMIFDLLGFGRHPSSFDPAVVGRMAAETFTGPMRTVADAISLPLDDVVGSGEVAVARSTIEIAAGQVDAGTIAAQRFEVRGMRGGRPLLRHRACWYLTRDVEPAWELRDTGWHVTVEGDVPLDVSIHFPVPPEQWGDVSPGLTAYRPVNSVQYVCSAEPGILTHADIPQIIPVLG